MEKGPILPTHVSAPTSNNRCNGRRSAFGAVVISLVFCALVVEVLRIDSLLSSINNNVIVLGNHRSPQAMLAVNEESSSLRIRTDNVEALVSTDGRSGYNKREETDGRSGYNSVEEGTVTTDGRSGYNRRNDNGDTVVTTDGRSGYNKREEDGRSGYNKAAETDGRSGYNRAI
ncbi:hypothetical protein CGCA056_v014043 [Colletotrichum aenigma]|uniref:uncharacterized protein n=1 Tax=Colletotrichum aenigma TaxID=1215731 RepID=UPI001872DC29|nr:uncharacterized protein CGCA056_v014043 [Colletotrichum aenigma]KAF5502503.1 hypothetical protein CGCA056_v014043 [Colletotrichum aenigma]